MSDIEEILREAATEIGIDISSIELMAAADEIERLRAENEKLREALEVIVNPIPAMQKQAEIDCVNLSGVMSIQIADSVNFLRSIARKALESGE